MPRQGGKQFANLTPIAIANQGASCRVVLAKTFEAVVEAHHLRRPNKIVTNKLTIWGILMMKPMFTVALSVGMALTLACSPSSDEAVETPAASAAPKPRSAANMFVWVGGAHVCARRRGDDTG